MNLFSRGVRNAFRNLTRTLSIVVILGLSIGLALSMLLAHQAVNKKIDNIESSVGTAITISPAGFNPASQANNALTTDALAKVKSLPHVTGVNETLTDRLTTIGSAQSEGPFGGTSTNSNNQTSLKSPITLNSDGSGNFSGGGLHVSIMGGGSLPADFSPPIQILGTTNPSQLQNDSKAVVKSGKLIDGTKDTDDAMVSTDMASKNDLKVGSTFTAYGQTLTVAGIFDTGTKGGNDVVVVSLAALQRLSNQAGVVTDATATVDSVANLSAATSAIKNSLGSSADVVSPQDQANDTIQPLKTIQSVSLYSLIGAIVAGAVIIFLVMLMVVRERRREIGVLKAIGAGNLRVVGQFMVEAVTLTVLAAVVGILISVVAADPITKTLVNNSSNSASNSSQTIGGPTVRGDSGTVSVGGGSGFSRGNGRFVAPGQGLGRIGSGITNINAAVGWSVIGYGLGAAIVIALAGSAIASFSISKVRPAEVLRTE